MKKFLLVFAMAALPLTIGACGGDDDDADNGDNGSFCMAGELDCACTPANASGCNDAANQCVEGICIACTPGEMGCICTPNLECTDASTCNADGLCL